MHIAHISHLISSKRKKTKNGNRNHLNSVFGILRADQKPNSRVGTHDHCIVVVVYCIVFSSMQTFALKMVDKFNCIEIEKTKNRGKSRRRSRSLQCNSCDARTKCNSCTLYIHRTWKRITKPDLVLSS